MKLDATGSDNSNEIIFNALDTSTTYTEAVEKMAEFNPVKKEQERILEEFQSKKEQHGNIYFYNIFLKYLSFVVYL